MYIVTHRNFFFALSALMLALSLGSLALFGLQPSIDFTGGTLVQATYEGGRPPAHELEAALKGAGFEGFSLRSANEADYVLRAGHMTEAMRAELPETLTVGGAYPVAIGQLSEIGPTIGTELRNKAFLALGLVLACILFFIAFAFRKVSKPVSSWLYGFIALATLTFDVTLPVGFFAFLGSLTGAQVDTLFVTAILTILGYSVHDTIVVFDRTRENLRINEERNRKEPFADTAGRALGETFVRSMNTSLTTIIVLALLFALGPASTKDFSLTLLVGIIAGTYSSIFLATPLLVAVERYRAKRS